MISDDCIGYLVSLLFEGFHRGATGRAGGASSGGARRRRATITATSSSTARLASLGGGWATSTRAATGLGLALVELAAAFTLGDDGVDLLHDWLDLLDDSSVWGDDFTDFLDDGLLDLLGKNRNLVRVCLNRK